MFKGSGYLVQDSGYEFGLSSAHVYLQARAPLVQGSDFARERSERVFGYLCSNSILSPGGLYRIDVYRA